MKQRHVVVIGAGVIGTSTAWFLARKGFRVTVVERQPDVALETSFANGGQISVSHAEPWATPANLIQAMKWLGKEDAPLLFRPRLDRHQMAWALQFLRECLPGRVARNTREMVALALHSRQTLGALREALPLAYDQTLSGILHIYSDEAAYRHGLEHAARLRQFGCEREPLSRDECLQLEPALAAQADRLVGGTYTVADEMGDARLFTEQLAQHCRQAGVVFRFNTQVERLLCQGRELSGVVVNENGFVETLTADAYVLCAGSFSYPLARTIGVSLPVYPAKGYSITLPIPPEAQAPRVSLIDEQYRIVVSRLGQRLRVAGTAEFTGFNTDLNAVRGQALVDRIQSWFPDLAAVTDIEHWAGLRPATPGNVPLLGPSAVHKLWLNTGHGTLGWTLSCGSAAALADLIDARQPEPVFPFLTC